MSEPGHVIAVGARTSVGLTAEASAAAVRAGISRVREHPFIIDMQGELRRMAFDARLATTQLGWRRLVALGASALREVFAKLERGEEGTESNELASFRRIPVFLALPELRPGFDDNDARGAVAALPEAAGCRPDVLDVEICGRGHAGALRGIELARERLAARRCELCLVGGVDSYLEADTLDWLESARRLNADGVRNGFYPGEGAAFIALATTGVARSLRRPVLATFRGARTSTERRVFDGGEEVLGHGLAEAIAGAAVDLRIPAEAVDAVFCDINGERYRNDEWAFAVLRTPQVLRDVAFDAPADCWGDVGAASAALGCVLAVRAWARRYAPGPRALVWASSDRGLRGAAILEAPRG